MPLVVSVMGFSREELAELAAAVGERDEVAMLELNVSCPNVETGLVMGADPSETALAVERVRSRDRQAADREAHAERHGSRCRGRRGAGRRRRRRLARQHAEGHGAPPADGGAVAGGRTGGVSGPAIRAIALEQVAAVASAVEIPVIGMGGIATGRHAADFLAAGATAVAVGTESFRDPAAGRRIAAELDALSLGGRTPAPASTIV